MNSFIFGCLGTWNARPDLNSREYFNLVDPHSYLSGPYRSATYTDFPAATLLFSDIPLPHLHIACKPIVWVYSTSLTSRFFISLVGAHYLTLSVRFPPFSTLRVCFVRTMSSQNGLKRDSGALDTPPSGSKPTKIRRALAACKNCRKQKTRCDHTGAPCHRCKVLG